MNIQKDVKVELNLMIGNDEFFMKDPNGGKRMIAISIKEGLCIMYIQHIDPDGYKWNNMHGTYAFRAIDDGIQFFDGFYWRYFDNKVQEQWSDYIAEKVLLEE